MWTTQEVHEKITLLEQALEDGYEALAVLATSSSQLHWLRKKLEAVAYIASRPEGRSNAEERSALALLYVFENDGILKSAFPDGIPNGVIGTQIDEHGFAAELAEKVYVDKRARIRDWGRELDLARTLLVSAREVAP